MRNSCSAKGNEGSARVNITRTKTMHCESCSSVTVFDYASPIGERRGEQQAYSGKAPTEDYSCQACGWYQTSEQGGHSEVLCSWLNGDGQGLAITERGVLAEYIWRATQAEEGRFYAECFADELLSLVKRLHNTVHISTKGE